MTAKCYGDDNNGYPELAPCWDGTNGQAVPCCDAKAGDWCATNGLCVTTEANTDTPYFIDGCTATDWINGTIPGCPPSNCISST